MATRPSSEHETAAGDVLAAALDYARRGWHVLPLYDVSAGVCSCAAGEHCETPGKHPRIKGWPERASADVSVIAEWWRRSPSANVGILTGAKSGLIVLDVDPRHDGDHVLAALVAEHGPLPTTPTVLTGGGGVHYYFSHPGGRVEGCVLGPGLELKADGQFVVAPPSQT
jgi:putative DNA primase/helicase